MAATICGKLIGTPQPPTVARSLGYAPVRKTAAATKRLDAAAVPTTRLAGLSRTLEERTGRLTVFGDG